MFLPAFWLLVPGTLGVVGLSTRAGGDASGAALTDLVNMGLTMIGIAIGVMVGVDLERHVPAASVAPRHE